MKNANKFSEISISTAILYGLSDGEYTIGEIGRVDTLAVRIPAPLRKGGASAFTAFIEESVEYDAFPNETGFYPVRKDGKTVLAFYHEGRIEIISRKFARDVRLSGGLIDLDAEAERKEVLKHLAHLEKEVRKLKKEPKPKEKAPTIDEEVERLLRKKANGGLKYVPPKDDDDRLY